MITHSALYEFLNTKEDFSMFSETELMIQMFSNYRPSSKQGWKLTTYGYNILSKYIHLFECSVEEIITIKQQVEITKLIKSPYYIDPINNKFYCCDQFIASILFLTGVEGFIQTYKG